MDKEGKYIYCLVETMQERKFGPIGVGGRGDEVHTFGYSDLSVVVSKHPLTKYILNAENLLAHEKVVEEVMREFGTVLPVRFGTVAANDDEILSLLSRRYKEFISALRDFDHKVELGVKGIWTILADIFKEILDENPDIRKKMDEIHDHSRKNSALSRREMDRLIKDLLIKKKDREAETLIDVLKNICLDYRLNKPLSDDMFMNAAFLVAKGREREFDGVMGELQETFQSRVMFLYSGPLPPYNFVHIVIRPEEWEK